SSIGSIPVPSLNSPLPPALAGGSHRPGKIVSTSGARPIPIDPVQVGERGSNRSLRWRQITLLSVLLASLLFAGYWWEAGRGGKDSTLPLGLDPGAAHGP
ncbi:MAG: hypothetical protein KJN97_11800, partial [Deltaproteobacteria bacterium]|nr:hypothetical protein [Deltaproteobacteria bacterium]